MSATTKGSTTTSSPSEFSQLQQHHHHHHHQQQQQQQQQQQKQQYSNKKEEEVAVDFRESFQRDSTYILSALFAGVGSGAIASVTCAPLDLIRTRLQVWGELSLPHSKANVMYLLKDIYKRDGFQGFFRGLGASLVTVPFFWGVYFPLYDETKRQWNYHYPATNQIYIHCGSAVVAGVVSDLICNPMFVVRTRLQTEALHLLLLENKNKKINNSKQQQQHQQQQTRPKQLGIIQTMKSLYREGGLKIFWRGMTANIIGLSHVAVQFPVYERLKETFLHIHFTNIHTANHATMPSPMIKTKNTVMDLLLASGLSKMTAMLLTYPHEVIRSRMMDARGSHGHSLIQISSKIFQKEGLKGFYSGLPISLVRVIPNCCITFMSYELLLRYGQEHFC